MSLPAFQWSLIWRPWATLTEWSLVARSRISRLVSWLLGNRAPTAPSIEEKRAQRAEREQQRIAKINADIAKNPNREITIRDSKGKLLGGGISGIVEQLPSGLVIKSPWTGSRLTDCRRDLTTEYNIYKILGKHACLVDMIAWDPEECILTLEYMPNGTLNDYLRANEERIGVTQRITWAQEAATALQLLHRNSVIHSDIQPTNFLLDASLGLRISDFASASLLGYGASGAVVTRFAWPGFPWKYADVQQDIFAFGSLLYFIVTGDYPYEELPSNEVEANFKAQRFPELSSPTYKNTIHGCWTAKFASMEEVCNSMENPT